MGRSFSLLLLVGRGIIIGGSDKFSVDPKLKVKVRAKMKMKVKKVKMKVKVAASSLVAATNSLLIQS